MTTAREAGRYLYEKARTLLSDRKIAYQVLESPRGRPALADLARFCRAHETCFHPDPRVHAVLEGRREVWLHIQQYLKQSPDELSVLFGATGNQE